MAPKRGETLMCVELQQVSISILWDASMMFLAEFRWSGFVETKQILIQYSMFVSSMSQQQISSKHHWFDLCYKETKGKKTSIKNCMRSNSENIIYSRTNWTTLTEFTNGYLFMSLSTHLSFMSTFGRSEAQMYRNQKQSHISDGPQNRDITNTRIIRRHSFLWRLQNISMTIEM